MIKQSIKQRVKQLEQRIGTGTIEGRNVARVYFIKDDLYVWYLPNGEIEKITEAEYVKRGGTIVKWDQEIE